MNRTLIKTYSQAQTRNFSDVVLVFGVSRGIGWTIGLELVDEIELACMDCFTSFAWSFLSKSSASWAFRVFVMSVVAVVFIFVVADGESVWLSPIHGQRT